VSGAANGTAGAMNGAATVAAPPTTVDLGALPEAPASVTVKVLYRGHDLLFTLRGLDGRSVLGRLDAALTWLEQHGATPAGSSTSSTSSTSSGNGQAGAENAPTCPTHKRPMKAGRKGGWYCPAKIAEDDGTGKPLYCRAKAGGAS